MSELEVGRALVAPSTGAVFRELRDGVGALLSALEEPLGISKVLALGARRGATRVAGLLRVLSRPHADTHPRAPGAGPLPVPAARGRPGEGCVEFDWYVYVQ